MVEVICEKTGLKFEAATKRTKNHPKIMSILADASREDWYASAMEALKSGRARNLDSIDAFVALLNDARDRHFGRGKYDYRAYKSELLPQINEAINSFIAGNMTESLGDLSKKLAKEVVWPIVRASNASVDMQSRLVTETIESAMKPLRDAKDAAEKEERRQLLASFKDREVVKEQAYGARGDNPYAGDYKYFLEEKRVLRCIHSWYAKADADMDQFKDVVVCKFAIPTAEEMQSAEYLQCVAWMQDALKESEK